MVTPGPPFSPAELAPPVVLEAPVAEMPESVFTELGKSLGGVLAQAARPQPARPSRSEREMIITEPFKLHTRKQRARGWFHGCVHDALPGPRADAFARSARPPGG